MQSDIAVESATDDAQLEDVAPSPPVAPQDDATPNDAVPQLNSKAGGKNTTQHSVTGSLLPEDLISALGTDLEDESDAVDERPAHESAAAAPVATVADFDQVSSMSERDKRSRLKSRGLGGGSQWPDRPWLVAFLFVALIVATLTKISMQESEIEEAKQQETKPKAPGSPSRTRKIQSGETDVHRAKPTREGGNFRRKEIFRSTPLC